MRIEEATRELTASLSVSYDPREASSISSLVMEKLTGLPRSSRAIHKSQALTAEQLRRYEQYRGELARQRPVQYVLGEAWFCGMAFYVNEQVLIPRPETEELVEWILADISNENDKLTVLDVGTGSGCIAVSIKKKRPDICVLGADIDPGALNIACKNARNQRVAVDFFLMDMRDEAGYPTQELDYIVSNPPYIPEKQKQEMNDHVKNFEPARALFVPDEEPLRYYKALMRLAQSKLRVSGALFLEIHPDFATDISAWYASNGFASEIRKDMSGKNRMIKAWRNPIV